METNLFKEQVLEICKACSIYYQCSVESIYQKVDNQEVNRARRVAMYLAKEITQQSFPTLGKAFGGRHHTTIMSAHRKMQMWVNDFKKVRDQVLDIKEILEGQNIYDMNLPVGFQIVD